MSEVLDFSVEGKHTKFFDCYILSEDVKYMANMNLLSKLDHFERYFDGIFVKTLNSKPIYRFEKEHQKFINQLLTILYTGNYIFDDNVKDSIYFYDYIGFNDMISQIINRYKDYNYIEVIHVIKFIEDKEDILTNINYHEIYDRHIQLCLKNNNYNSLDKVDIKYIDLKRHEIFDNHVIYIKLVEYLYKRLGDSILYQINIPYLSKSTNDLILQTNVNEYIKSLDNNSPVKMYIIIKQIKRIHQNKKGNVEYDRNGGYYYGDLLEIFY